MALFKIDQSPLNRQVSSKYSQSILGADVYVHAEPDSDKIGTVHTALVDEHGQIRYLVVESGFWVFGKKFLLPIERCTDDPEQHRVYVSDLTQQQVQNLPAYADNMLIDEHYEQRVHSEYWMPAADALPLPSEASDTGSSNQRLQAKHSAIAHPPQLPYESAMPPIPASVPSPDSQPTPDGEHHLDLFEERLVAKKYREKTGEITITKRVETELSEASIPIRREKVIIEIESVRGFAQVSLPEGDLRDGSVARIDVYEERADIQKELVVRQQIIIRKEVEESVVTAQDVVRRETLEVREEGDPGVREIY